MPPIRSGSTLRVASTLRPDAFAIWSTIARASSSESSCAVVSSTVDLALVARRRAARTRARSPRPRRCDPSRRAACRKLRTSSYADPRDRLERRGLGARVELRVAQDGAELGHVANGRDEVGRLLAASPRPGPPPWQRRTAPAHTPDGRRPWPARPSPSPARRSPGRRSPPRSGGGGRLSSSDLARHLGGRLERQVRDLVADRLDRAPRLGLDLAPRLLHAARRVRRRAPASAAHAARHRPCAPRRGSPRPPPRPCATSALVLLEQLVRLRRGRGPPPRSTAGSARAARRSPTGSRLKANF